MVVRVLLYGAGGLGRIVSEICLSKKDTKLIGFIDDTKTGSVLDIPIIGNWENIDSLIESYRIDSIIICLGDGFSRLRWETFEFLFKNKMVSSPIIHEKAVISKHSSIGDGSIVMSLTVVGPDVEIGKNCVIYSSCNLEHDNCIGDNVFISPGAKICGYVDIGEHSFIGTNATIVSDIKIGINATIGAGATVIKDVLDNTVVAGNPAKTLKTKTTLEYHT